MSNYVRTGNVASIPDINAEFEKIENAIEDKLDRSPSQGQPNQMTSDLDMNSNSIINLPAPRNPYDAARLIDVQSSNNQSILPSQEGQDEEFLRTDGTTAYWDSVTKDTVGLSDVDNTSDANKPVSTATQTELDKRVESYATTAELEATTPTVTGQRAENRERANAPYVLREEGYVAKAGDLTAANGRVWALQIDGKANALWFGAKYDDLTDDSSAHNGGLARLNADGGGVLFLPAGTTRANIVHTYDNVGMVGTGRGTIVAPTSGVGVRVASITGGFGSLIGNFAVYGSNGASLGLEVAGFSRGKFGDFWIGDIDTGIRIDGDKSTEFTFENVYIVNPSVDGVLYERTDGVDTGGVYFDTLHVTGGVTSGRGVRVISSHTSRTRAFMFINKLILDNRATEAMLLENVESFFISQAWMTGTVSGKGMLTVRDVKDCFINQAWLQNSNAAGYNLLISGGASSDELADFSVDQLRTSGPGTSIQFNGSPTLTRCSIGEWNDTASTKTNDSVRLSQMRSFTLEGDLVVGGSLNIGSAFSTKTISSGAVTAESSCHRIAPESGTSDTLSTINGGTQGDILVIMSNSSVNTLTVAHASGNIYLDGAVDVILDSSRDKITLIKFGSEWQQIGASSNG